MTSRLARLRSSGWLHEAAGALLAVAGGAALVALLTYSAEDATWFRHQADRVAVHNWFGRLGGTVAEALLQLFGAAAFLTPLLAAGVGWRWLRRGPKAGWARPFAWTLLLVALCSLLDLVFGGLSFGGEADIRPGGYVGERMAGGLSAIVAWPGALLVSLGVVTLVLLLEIRVSPRQAVEATGRGAATGAALGRAWIVAGLERWRARRAEHERTRVAVPHSVPKRSLAPAEVPAAEVATAEPEPPAPLPEPRPLRPRVLPGPDVPAPERRRRAERPPVQAELPLEPERRGGYRLPPLDLLAEPEPQTIESEQELLERARQITDKLREFAVNGAVVAIHPGPVVTTFEFKPEAGVKYSKITGMTEDLSLALRAESVRIDRLAGRSTVGIEVPNRRQETIYPRELYASESFQSAKSLLTLALGKTISGDVFTAELDRMPHLLIAGATGSGKSVGLNGMIASILFKATPEHVRFLMIDTKMIELGIYADIPHLLVPVVTEPKQASVALKWAVREMEQRYRKLAAVGVRNLVQFNALLAAEPQRTMADPKGGDPLPLVPLPYIVIVIDELADLMMVSSADVEESIMRLAQMARAVGIHLIIATQRPSVDVITGTIKANFPSRVAFRVSQRVDSRTIIDQQGAEHLLGRGDMLFLKTGSSRLIRVHGGLITETELNGVVSFLKRTAQPVYDDSVLSDESDAEAEALDPSERDEMYTAALRTVIQEGKCSVTLIQRRLQLGYARAARIVDMMEREGVVSPGEGSKPREVLVGPEFLEATETR